MGVGVLRVSCRRAQRMIISSNLSIRMEEARGAAQYIGSYINEIENLLRAVANQQLNLEPDTGKYRENLRSMYPNLARLGAMDLVWLSAHNNEGIAAVSAVVNLRKIIAGVIPIKKEWDDNLGVVMSDFTIFRTADGKKVKGIAIVFPVFRKSAPEEKSPQTLEGYLIVPISLEKISRQIRGLFKSGIGKYLFIVSGDGRFIVHPDSSFIGTLLRDAMNLGRFTRLKMIVKKMMSGEEGMAFFEHYDAVQGIRIVRWWMVYTPVHAAVQSWSVGIMEEQSSIPAHGMVGREYFLVGIGFVVLMIASGAILYAGTLRHLQMELKIKEMKDVTVVSNLMRSVNEELADEKREVEISREKNQIRLRNAREGMNRLARICSRMFVSFRHPTREQRDLVREMKKEITNLMSELEE